MAEKFPKPWVFFFKISFLLQSNLRGLVLNAAEVTMGWMCSLNESKGGKESRNFLWAGLGPADFRGVLTAQ